MTEPQSPLEQKIRSLVRIDGTDGRKVNSREGTRLEFKQSFNWLSRSAYAKSLASFANNKGGYLIFGISDSPRRLLGLASTTFQNLDEAKISEYLNSVLAPAIEFDKGAYELAGVTIGYIAVSEADHKPIVCIKNDGDHLREGDIYYRYSGRSQRIRYPELSQILRTIEEHERERWLALFEKISQIGVENTALLDTYRGKIEGTRGALLIDEDLLPKLRFIQEGAFAERGQPVLKLVGDVHPVKLRDAKRAKPVQISTAPDAQRVVLEEEDLTRLYPMDYSALTKALKKRYTNFLENNTYHSLRKNLKTNKNYCRTRYLDPVKKSGTAKDFYSERIIDEFDKHYERQN